MSEILTILIEECAEVQQRATKLLRFGRNEVQPGQPFTNGERLGREVGDLIYMVDRAMALNLFSHMDTVHGRISKKRQLAKFLQTAA